MMEKTYTFALTDDKLIERLVDDPAMAINHMVLPGGGSIPEHMANTNIYLIILRGEISIRLNDSLDKRFIKGSIVSIPEGTRMQLTNQGSEPYEMFVVRVPNKGL